MSISSISKYQFDLYNPAVQPMAAAFSTEKSWFVDDKKSILGTVVLDHSDKDWNIVILGKDQNGTFRYIEGDTSIETQEEAERRLISKMNELEQSGKTSFPQ